MLSIGSSAIVNVPPVYQTVETVLVALPSVSIPKDSVQVFLAFSGYVLTGAGTTGITLKIREGNGITGQLVGQMAIDTLSANVRYSFTVFGLDTLIGAGQFQWCVTGTGTGSTGNNVSGQTTGIALFLS